MYKPGFTVCWLSAIQLTMNSLNRGIVYVLLAPLFWGLSGVFAQFLFRDRAITPEWLVCVRLLIPGFILLLFAALRSVNIFAIWLFDTGRIALFSIFGIAAAQLSYFMAIKESNAATATVLQYLSPVIVAAVITVKLRRLPSARTVAAIVLALAGTFFITTHGNPGSLSISGAALAWGLGSAFAFTFYVMYSVNLVRKWNGMMVIGWGMFAGGVMLSLFIHPWNIPGVWNAGTFASIAFVVFFGGLISYYFYLMGIQSTGSQAGTILSCTEPLHSALFSIIFLGVHFTGMDWLGLLCIISTVIILTVRR